MGKWTLAKTEGDTGMADPPSWGSGGASAPPISETKHIEDILWHTLGLKHIRDSIPRKVYIEPESYVKYATQAIQTLIKEARLDELKLVEDVRLYPKTYGEHMTLRQYILDRIDELNKSEESK